MPFLRMRLHIKTFRIFCIHELERGHRICVNRVKANGAAGIHSSADNGGGDSVEDR